MDDNVCYSADIKYMMSLNDASVFCDVILLYDNDILILFEIVFCILYYNRGGDDIYDGSIFSLVKIYGDDDEIWDYANFYNCEMIFFNVYNGDENDE